MSLFYSLLRLGWIAVIAFFGLGIAMLLDIYVMDIVGTRLVELNVIPQSYIKKYFDPITIYSIWIMVGGFALRASWLVIKGVMLSIFGKEN